MRTGTAFSAFFIALLVGLSGGTPALAQTGADGESPVATLLEGSPEAERGALPLGEALASVAARHNVSFLYQRKEIEEKKITGNESVTLQVRLGGLEARLKEMLVPYGLTIDKIGSRSYVITPAGPLAGTQKIPPRGLKSSAPGRDLMQKAKTAALIPARRQVQAGTISGTVTDSTTGAPLPGVNVVIEGTQQGASTGPDGTYDITGVEQGTYTLAFSFVGYEEKTIPDVTVRSEAATTVDVTLAPSTVALQEVVAIGYGTEELADVTGSISSADVDEVAPATVSIMSGLQGAVPGLSIGQQDEAGEDPSFIIRGQTSLSGSEDPLIVVDDVVYRGNLIDLNANDIKSVDVLKDASAAAVYGSQAANGVIVITTKKSGSKVGQGPTVTFSSQIARQEPWRELWAQSPEAFMQKIIDSDLEEATTKESGYTERNPEWEETTNFKTNHEVTAFKAGQPYDWYDQVTASAPYTTKQNISVANQTETSNYFISGGVAREQGYLKDEGFTRINARANLDSEVTDWLDIGLQSYLAVSTYDAGTYGPSDRYIEPYANAYEIGDGGDVTGTLVQRPYGNPPNPLIVAQSNADDKRLNINGNLVFEIDLPVDGLSYKGNVYNSFRTSNDYFFGSHVSDFQGGGHKDYDRFYDLSSDHILNFSRTFAQWHSVDGTFLFGLERRTNNFTNASATGFNRQVLGYNRLQVGAADRQAVSSGGWKETTLYGMGRINYNFNSKYLLTATLRRDGFSGFADTYKWGYFPSVAVGWVLTEEPFLDDLDWLSRLKVRASYGTVGNRTVGRYQTLARVSLDASYVDAGGSSLLGQTISSLASPSLKWERTTGIDVGVDYELLNGRISGKIDYYNKNTTDLLYQVDIPAVTGFETFPDNLGKIHNHGLELELSTTNMQRPDFEWSSSVVFSRNRNEIQQLLGDIDGDGQEDDLVSEGLFIGESLGAIYDYEIDGLWQLDDDIPEGYEFGAYKVVDRDGDGEITPDDRTILGAGEPSYRFGIRNNLSYHNWSLSFFINSVQGGGHRYLGEDTIYGLNIFNNETHFNLAFPEDLDYWTPSNTDARYQRPGINGSSGIAGTRYASRSFVRLRNVRLQYRVNANLTQNWGVNTLSVYIGGSNLITWTDWNGWDPASGDGISLGSRPVMRAYSAGLNLSL